MTTVQMVLRLSVLRIVSFQSNIVELNAGNGISISTSADTLVGAPEQGTSTVLPPFLDFP